VAEGHARLGQRSVRNISQPNLDGHVFGVMPTGTADKMKRAECDFVSKTTAEGELARPDMYTSRGLL
jgi:hypothetical protein